MRQLTEQKVLNRLGIEDFRHLTKAKVIQLASMIDKMNPDVAKKALEQFPEFSCTCREIVSELKQTLDKGMNSANESVQASYQAYNATLTSLQALLENENLSFEERKYIIDEMKDISDKVSKKDMEYRNWILSLMALATGTALGVVAILGSTLGANTNMQEIGTTDDTSE